MRAQNIYKPTFPLEVLCREKNWGGFLKII